MYFGGKADTGILVGLVYSERTYEHEEFVFYNGREVVWDFLPTNDLSETPPGGGGLAYRTDYAFMCVWKKVR